jgi:hypothetical protein
MLIINQKFYQWIYGNWEKYKNCHRKYKLKFMKFEAFNSLFSKKEIPDVSQLDNKRLFRTELLSDKDKRKLGKLIDEGKISKFHDSYHEISKTIGRKEYSRMRKESITADKNSLIEEGVKRKNELLSLGRERDPFILDTPINIFSIHSKHNDSLEDVSSHLPQSINRNLIEVGYQENTNNKIADPSTEDDKTFRLVDSSGKIDKSLINNLINNQEKASFAMFGGNLRGCFLSALDSVLYNSDIEEKVKKLDIHIPLDKCYDDDVYKKITGYDDIKAAIQDKMMKTNSELYEDKQLVFATGNPEELESKYRFYLWNNSDVMGSEMNNQIELENLRKDISNLD